MKSDDLSLFQARLDIMKLVFDYGYFSQQIEIVSGMLRDHPAELENLQSTLDSYYDLRQKTWQRIDDLVADLVLLSRRRSKSVS